MLILPLLIVFLPNGLSESITFRLYDLSHLTIFLVMIIRPLADILTKTKLIRPLVILRKSVGVLSASVIISFIFAKIIIDPTNYFASFFTANYWSLNNYLILAHLADISAILLLITSNNFSKRILGVWWKRIQKLSYLYFYASSFYVFYTLDNNIVLFSIIIVTVLTTIAYIINRKKY